MNTPTQSNSSYTAPASKESSHKAKEAFRKWEQGEDNYQQAIFTCFKNLQILKAVQDDVSSGISNYSVCY